MLVYSYSYSKKTSEIRDQNIPILSEKCYNSGLQHDTCLLDWLALHLKVRSGID